MIQAHHLNWTAWCFHPKSSPRLLLEWNYTRRPFWGAFAKRALTGERFEAKRLR